MTVVSHQTVRLEKGKHAAPCEGVCVMELASMLGDEQFSDRPDRACPVIASFLRTYNDYAGDKRRQDLYRYASKVLGTRSDARVEHLREQRLLAWARELKQRRLSVKLRLVSPEITPNRRYGRDAVGRAAALSLTKRQYRTMHPAVLDLIDELIAIGSYPKRETSPDDNSVSETVLVKA